MRETLIRDLSRFNAATNSTLFLADHDAWLADAEAALELASPDTALIERARTLVAIAECCAAVGRYADAHRRLDVEVGRFGVGDRDFGAGVHLARAVLRANADRAVDLRAVRRELFSLLIEQEWRAIFARSVAAPVAAVHGDRRGERAELDIGLEYREQADALVAAAFGAWLCGEHQALRAYLDRMEALTAAAAATSLFVASARGQVAAESGESLATRVRAYIVAAFTVQSDAQRHQLGERAAFAADALGRPYLAALAHACAALHAAAGDAGEHWEIARACAARTQSTKLIDAVAALHRGDAPEPFIAAFAPRRTGAGEAGATPELRVALLDGAIAWNGVRVDLAGRPRDVVILLALAEGRLGRRSLCERMWPDREPEDMTGALRVHISSVRAALGRNAVVHENGTYRIAARCICDIDEVAAELKAFSLQPPASVDRPQLTILVERLSKLTNDRAAGLPPSVALHVTTLRARAAGLLCRAALDAGDPAQALVVARTMTDADQCDEVGREMALRALLAQDRHAEARAEFRAYETILRTELGVEAPEAMRELVTT